jgi:hypothetical protein
MSAAAGVAKYQFYLKGTGPASAAGHRFIGLIIEGLADGSGISIKQTVFNSGEQFGVSKQVGILGSSLIENNPITLGTTIDFNNNTTSFWVNSPGEYSANPWGLTSATGTHDNNQSVTWGANTIAAAANIILKQLQFNIVSKDGTVNVNQFKISTGDYENTLSTNLIEKNTLNIYPNPADDIINVFSAGEFGKVDIYNVSGQKVYSDKLMNNNSLNVGHLDSGIYLIKSDNKYSKFIKK